MKPFGKLLDHSISDIISTCEEINLPSFVGKQLIHWISKRYVISLENMTNISKKNKSILADSFLFSPFKSTAQLPSKDKLAIKCIHTLHDNHYIESVILKEKNYYTLCVSSQSGCPMDCKFCLTGVIGFKRQLTPAEIIGQVLYANEQGYAISNLVFMGMGEPLLNYDNVFKAIDFLIDERAFNMSKRKITLSTIGYTQGIKRLIADQRFVNLAFSVGSTDPEKRLKIMPNSNRNSLKDILPVLKEYQRLHNRKLTLEYTLLDNLNDSQDDAQGLAHLAKTLQAKINLINLNPHQHIPFKPVSIQKLHWFKEILTDFKRPVTIRFKKGQDVSAACGQLGESYIN